MDGRPVLKRFVFVILNYESTSETIKCIRTIENLSYQEKRIVVVDNNSQNYSFFFKILKTEFEYYQNITYIETHKNLGYARGNNIGIDFARNELKADYVCVINPDVIILNQNFIEKSIEIFSEENTAVIGPRIVTNGVEVNPLAAYSEDVFGCIKSAINDYRIYLTKKYKLSRFNPLRHSGNRGRIDKNLKKHTAKRNEQIELKKDMNMQLSGACLIFTPSYFSTFSGFCNETFLYCEECILAFVCYNLGYKMVYSPELLTEHEGGKSMENVEKNEDSITMNRARAGAHSCMVEAKIFCRKSNREYLKKVLNPKVDNYELIM